MIPAQPTHDEARRIEALRQYDVLDTLPEEPSDDLAALAAQICEAPIALISLADEKRQWFKAKIGWEATETKRDTSFCGHAIHQRDLFVIPDATRDERFADNPMVTGEPGIRFYAGAPLISREGMALGALCVIDRVPRTLTLAQEQTLKVLARAVMTHLELRRRMNDGVESEGKFPHLPDPVAGRKRAETQMAEQAALLHQTQDAIFVADLQGRILFWNKAAERMYGWAAPEAMNRHVGELIHADPAKFLEASALALEKGEWAGELRHFTKNRRELMIEARWSLLRDKEGRPKSVLAVHTDVTEKKKIEAQSMRTQRLESIGTLAGGIAHDLNNILSPIMMSVDILKTTPDTAKLKKILEIIETSAKRGADIVRQVLLFARGMEGQRTEIQPKYLLKELESLIRDTFPRNIRLQLALPEEPWTLLGDPGQIHQILLNLCFNARDAMPNGGTLTLGAENRLLDEQDLARNIEARPGPYVVLSITDSGIGIPTDIIDKIFEPFFTTREVGQGAGLGLSAAMGIVKSHHGFITVYSEPGRGTIFKVYLPAESISPEGRAQSPPLVDLPRGKGETILLVDDEPAILTITGQTLQAFGYRVLEAANGAEAIAVYAQHRQEIDVVLTDMAMPIMDGPATILALTKMNGEVKIIAASGLTADGSGAKASGISVKHFLTKPYSAEILLKVMRAVLDEVSDSQGSF